MVSVPYGVMLNSSPAAATASQVFSPYQAGTLISYAVFCLKKKRQIIACTPENEIRQILACTPEARVVSRNVMNGKASASRPPPAASSGASLAITARDFGPTTAMVDHCSVT